MEELRQGIVLDGWQLQRPIGTGGQGQVWRVASKTTKHSPRRAMKICVSSDPKARARFEQEIRLLQACRHQHVVPVLEDDTSWKCRGQLPELSYFVMPLARCSIDRLELLDTHVVLLARFFLEACAAVSFLHDQPSFILHRDLKPDNVLILDEPLRAAVADFGIATEESQQGSLTAAAEVVGSLHYRAPEVAAGEEPTIRSDVYGLGRILERLLTGKLRAGSEVVQLNPVVPMSDRLREHLRGVVQKATAWTPSDRYTSVRELSADIPSMFVDLVEPPTQKQPVLGGTSTTPSSSVTARVEPKPAHIPIAPRPGDVVGYRSRAGKDQEISLAGGPFAFLSIPPQPGHNEIEDHALLEFLRDRPGLLPFGFEDGTFSTSRNTWGAAVFETPDDADSAAPSTARATQLLKNRSIVGIDVRLLGYVTTEGVSYLPSLALEQSFERYLVDYVGFCERKLNLSAPLIVHVGVVGIEKHRLQLPHGFSQPLSDRTFQQSVVRAIAIEQFEMKPPELLRPFYNQVWSAFGLKRPDVLRV